VNRSQGENPGKGSSARPRHKINNGRTEEDLKMFKKADKIRSVLERLLWQLGMK
jgi:hypothetical protein